MGPGGTRISARLETPITAGRGLGRSVSDCIHTCLASTVSATVDLPAAFDSVTNDAAATMSTARCKRMNCAFKTVKNVLLAINGNAERLGVVVSAYFTLSHDGNLLTEMFL